MLIHGSCLCPPSPRAFSGSWISLKISRPMSQIDSWSSLLPWASCQIRKNAGCACAGNVFPRRRFKRKPLVSDPGMHHGTCVTHVPWCMSGSLTCGDGENVPGIPGACAPAILRIWQEAHCMLAPKLEPSALVSCDFRSWVQDHAR